ncbi:hypothetical protein N0M98_13310 [Paenibacillus doosanensis]|uniref:Pilus assembly protein n=1 Tax=Paenibacillus konkukensis TaxID=2020716 RepID=A0ABY4RJW4_9BACL|nr:MULTISPECIES: hypothetical protein [Paenibacillus]MCS7461126.1 hypothetical protein [Paenibacillus doosanensis]UQZ81622.1 hypothetical protein SK3146_00778 [Paenibacillus konkukensis]
MKRLWKRSSKPGLRFFRDGSGSFTIEASFVLPVILISTIALLFLGLYVFQTSSAFQRAGLAADRAAFTWDDTARDPVTGDADPNERSDGLYWRLTNDSMSDLFRFLIPNAGAQVALPASSGYEDGPELKLSKAGALISKDWNGKMEYVNNGLSREVTVQLDKPFRSPLFAAGWLNQQVASEAEAQIVDPMESIRLVDLTRTFIKEVQGRIKPAAALKAMKEPNAVPESPAQIIGHKEAAAYLRALVNGTGKTFQVNASTTRVVDAMDANQVAHQAYFNFKEKQLLEEQLPKDVALLRNGTEVKGVVWHFFKLRNQDKVKLSESFKRELERQGIVIVIHE